jgi:hypothetical protein
VVRRFLRSKYWYFHTNCKKSSLKSIKNNIIRLENDNGNFKISETNIDYSHKITYPKGSWYRSACTIAGYAASDIAIGTTHYPNSVCAFFLIKTYNSYVKAYGTNVVTPYYEEDCIEYDENDFLIVENHKFKKLATSLPINEYL